MISIREHKEGSVMSSLVMNRRQQFELPRWSRATARKPAASSDPLWRLAAGCLQRLPAVRAARWVRVHEGALWLTADGRPGAPPPQDWWLLPGQSLRLPARTPVLLEGWPTASFEVLEDPGA
jgi:hypothetical protein